MAHGSHIMLDCTGAVGVEGSWMLSLMEKAVDASGARRVHSHNEDFDGSVSPLGFASVVLLDESHVSAHCYSETGLLAVCLLYTSPSPRDLSTSRMPSSA